MNKLRRFLPLIFLLIFTLILYRPFFFSARLPIPADTIVGLYHPWRDFYADRYPSGIPFKNFQITDSVRQQYPWRNLALNLIKRGEIPLWNPYSFSGTPLLANLQSAAFYPLNSLYFLLPFSQAWSWQVILQTLLGGLFMYFYLRNLNLRSEAVTLGVLSWVGSGLFIAWLEWNTAVHVALWLPLILLFIDKIFFSPRKIIFILLLSLSLSASFLGGYLQPFIYVLSSSALYIAVRLYQTRNLRVLPLFVISYVLFLILALPQLVPTLRFILLSARDIDQSSWQRPDWFLPWQNLVQFVAPDFFGNPATLNYFGVWNYQEFVGFIGAVGLIFSLFAMLVRKDRKTIFFFGLLLGSLILSLPTPLAKIPYVLSVPFLSTAQPSRLILIADFSLAVLSALGLDWLLQKRSDRRIFLPLGVLSLILGTLWLISFKLHLSVSLRNLYLPAVILILAAILILFTQGKSKFAHLAVIGLLVLTLFDLSRFAGKFEPFSPSDYLYPSTPAIKFLQEKSGKSIFRIAVLDDRILPPNFNIMSGLETISGYDPLYLRRYGEYIIAMERNQPNTKAPWGFNRIIVPKNISSPLFSLLSVRYVLSLSEIHSPDLVGPVFQEGNTKIYEFKHYFPRAFIVDTVISSKSKEETLKRMFTENFAPSHQAVVENWPDKLNYSPDKITDPRIIKYSENEVVIKTNSTSEQFLVLTDSYYPSWQATIDDKLTVIYITDYTFRGVLVPPGAHTIKFFIR